MPRSGTNFLYNLLMLHPDCAPPDPIWEDFLIAESDKLMDYTRSVASHWKDDWGANADILRQFEASLGAGISRFLEDRCNGKQVVTKSPRVNHIDHFFRLFPNSRLLILVRDGRAIVETGVRSFGWHREAALHTLADAAHELVNFLASHSDSEDRIRLLRYEDLWSDTEAEMTELLRFLGLDEADYDYAQARELPVRGSSDLRSEDRQSIHWKPLKRASDFDPLSRFAAWGNARHFRYNHVAGRALEALGYTRQPASSRLGALHAVNILLDAAWPAAKRLRPLYRRLRRR